jgi:hypothetical protein
MKFLLMVGDEWHLSIRNSRNKTNGGLGLFSENHFYPGGVVTFFMGPVRWYGAKKGGPLRTPEELRKKYPDVFGNKNRIVVMRDLAGLVFATSHELFGGDSTVDLSEMIQELYLGAHYINDPTSEHEYGTTSWTKAARRANVRMMEDGTIVAKREIKYDDEILMVYNEMPDLEYGGEFNYKEGLVAEEENHESDLDKKVPAKPIAKRGQGM